MYGWYLFGTSFVIVTNWLSVRVPVEMAAGLDALRSGEPGASRAAAHIALLGLGVIVARTTSRVLFFTPGRLAEFALREDLFAHLLKLQPDFYARQTTGDLLSRATIDVTYARAFAGFALLQALNVVAAVGFTTGQMLLLSPTLTLLCVVPIALAFVVIQQGTGRLLGLQRRAQAQLALLADDMLGTLQGMSTIQAFRVEAAFTRRLVGRGADLRSSSLEMARLRALIFPLMTVASGVCVFFLLGAGGTLATRGELSPGTIAGFVALVAYLLNPLRLLGFLVPVFQRAEASLERVYTVLDAVPTRPDIPTGIRLGRGAGPALELRNLTFAWPDDPARPVLSDLSVRIEGGQTVGIFGRTGAGKTTLLKILARLVNPPRATVFVEGVDLVDLDLGAWRDRLVYVSQVPFLFSETIAENVGLGAGAEAVERAVADASLAPDLQALPEGLQTVVGERGVVLSGGQRQRVALARGLARKGDLILLDDVLSAVDHRTERELLDTLNKGGNRATRLIVSHRLSAMEAADLILVIDGGRLVDQGTHLELIAREGAYRDAWAGREGR